MSEVKNPTPAPTVAAPKPVGSATATMAARSPLPPSLTKGNTNLMDTQWFRVCLYSEYKARKTSTAARFSKPEDAFIVLTRSIEQLKPLEGSGYDYAHCKDATALRYALMYPERVARDGWATNQNRTLIVDDMTEAVSMLLTDARGGEDNTGFTRMRAHDRAGSELRDLLTSLRLKPQHLVVVALAKVRDNQITNEERVAPDLPPAMLNFVMTDLDHVFYINPKTWQLLTERHYFAYEDVDASGKKQNYSREIFASHKVPFGKAGKVLQKYENLDLAAVWGKIRNGATTPTK